MRIGECLLPPRKNKKGIGKWEKQKVSNLIINQKKLMKMGGWGE
jgi:hypothetical protein